MNGVLLTIILFWMIPAFAQMETTAEHELRLWVIDSERSEGIPFVALIMDGSRIAFSDFDGLIYKDTLVNDTTMLTIEAFGYIPRSIRLSEVIAIKNVSLEMDSLHLHFCNTNSGLTKCDRKYYSNGQLKSQTSRRTHHVTQEVWWYRNGQVKEVKRFFFGYSEKSGEGEWSLRSQRSWTRRGRLKREIQWP